VQVERGLALQGFEQDADGVTATLTGDAGQQDVRVRYLIGADGAHSLVRKSLGLSFSGGAFDEQYMLGDVEVDWALPAAFVARPDGYLGFVSLDVAGSVVEAVNTYLRGTFG
jgi:2-polyprenyl-6-methoxyphenol hydroxylase-like FAD-dependent oxidoreductase